MPFAAIHGDKQQNERDWVLNEFKTGKSPIMVATDVASRGIGMIETPLSCTATPSRLHSSALLSTLRHFVDCVFVRVLSCLSVLYQRVSWIYGAAYSCFIRNSKLKVLFRVQDVELAFLDLIKLSPRLPNQRTWMCGSLALALNPAMDSSCQMLREYWMHLNAASSLAALERCYTYFSCSC